MIYIFCIYFILFVYVLRCFDILPNLSGWGEIAPPGATHFSVGSMPLICILNSPEPYLLYLACPLQEAVFLFLNHSVARYKQPETICIAQRPPELFTTRIIETSQP